MDGYIQDAAEYITAMAEGGWIGERERAIFKQTVKSKLDLIHQIGKHEATEELDQRILALEDIMSSQNDTMDLLEKKVSCIKDQ